MAYLVSDVLLVFVCHIMAISVRFQWVFKGLLNIFLNLYPALYVFKRLVTSVAIVFFEMIATLTRRQYKRTVADKGLRTADCGLGIGGPWTTEWV